MKQKASGNFPSDTLQSLGISISTEELRKYFPPAVNSQTPPPNPVDLDSVLVTVVVCCYLARKYADQQIQFDLVVKKAQGWIKREVTRLKVGTELEEWEAAAKRLLSTIHV